MLLTIMFAQYREKNYQVRSWINNLIHYDFSVTVMQYMGLSESFRCKMGRGARCLFQFQFFS